MVGVVVVDLDVVVVVIVLVVVLLVEQFMPVAWMLVMMVVVGLAVGDGGRAGGVGGDGVGHCRIYSYKHKFDAALGPY